MTPRDRLQKAYELAFHPPSLFAFWQAVTKGQIDDRVEIGRLLDEALRLHQALPATGYGSQRALARVAAYQARARAFDMVRRLRGYRRILGLPPLAPGEIPPGMIRDIKIPPIARDRQPEAQP